MVLKPCELPSVLYLVAALGYRIAVKNRNFNLYENAAGKRVLAIRRRGQLVLNPVKTTLLTQSKEEK